MTWVLANRVICIMTIGLLSLSASYGQSSDCAYQEKGIDLQSKTYQIIVAGDLVFNHTPLSIKNELGQDNLMEVSGYVSEIGERTALHLNIRINSLQAQKHFGSINPGFMSKVTLIDGKEHELICTNGSNGQYLDEEKAYIYHVMYDLSSKQIKNLSKKEIDKWGIQWTSGYEDYTIYQVDFLMNQIKCLKRAQQARPN